MELAQWLPATGEWRSEGTKMLYSTFILPESWEQGTDLSLNGESTESHTFIPSLLSTDR